MDHATVKVEIGAEHLHGTIDTTVWPLDGSQSEVLVQLDDGRQLLIPFAAASRQEDGSYAVSLRQDAREHRHATASAEGRRSAIVPVMVEELDVRKRKVEQGRVRIIKTVHERQELIDEPLFREEVTIERVPINRIVDEPIPLRYEGDTIIVSVLEEVPVIEKRLMLKEELRITRRPVESRKPFPVTVRREEASVEYIQDEKTDEPA
jgi:uncharacterized protein (TIGR02271 family)